MHNATPSGFPTRHTPCLAVGFLLRSLCAWLILLTGVQAQTSTSDTSTTTTDTSTSGGLIISGATLTLNNTSTLSDTTISGVTIDSSSISSSVTFSSGIILGSNLYTGATSTSVASASSGLTLSSAATFVGSTSTTLTSISSASNTLTINGSTNYLSNATTGTILIDNGGANTAASMLSSLGTLPTSGSLVLTSGGVFNLASISASGLTVVGSTSLTAAGGTTLGSTGLAITTAGTATTQSTSFFNVTPLGSVPVGKPSTSGSFSNAVMSLVGIGNVSGVNMTERGVLYAPTSISSTPTLSTAGVTKITLGGQPDSAGSFSLPTGGLAPSTSYAFRIYAIDSAGNTYLSTPATFTTPTVLQNWRQTFFGTTQGTNTAADNADPDKDGVPNLIEFATGKNPTVSSNSASPTTSVNSAGSLEYTYTRSLDALNSGTTFTVEWNDTLDPAQWSSTGVTEIILADDGLIQQVKATLPAGATGHRFVHLKVTPPPAQ